MRMTPEERNDYIKKKLEEADLHRLGEVMAEPLLHGARDAINKQREGAVLINGEWDAEADDE